MPILRFGAFELDTDAAELLRQGERIALPPQPFKVLALLVKHSGAVVTRADIRDQVWGAETHVEFDQGLNYCIRQIREALGDDAEAPRYVETLPRRGYRFVAPVTSAAPVTPGPLTRIIVLPFRQLRDDPDTAYLSFSLPDAVTSSLSGLESLVVRSSLVAARYAGNAADTSAIGAETDVDVIVTGTLLRSGGDVRVHAQLTECASGTLLWSHTAQAPVSDLFQLQDELARCIVESLAVPLTARDRRRLGSDVPASKAAYDFFLRGNQLSIDPKQWGVARDLYERAVAEDPRFAPAWARLGRLYHVETKYIEGVHDGGLTRAETAFKKALELNADLPDRAQALRATRGRPRPRARGAGTADRPRPHRRPRTHGRPRERLPLLRPARRLGRGAPARATARRQDRHERDAYLVHAGRRRARRAAIRGGLPVSSSRWRSPSSGAATKRCPCCARSRPGCRPGVVTWRWRRVRSSRDASATAWRPCRRCCRRTFATRRDASTWRDTSLATATRIRRSRSSRESSRTDFSVIRCWRVIRGSTRCATVRRSSRSSIGARRNIARRWRRSRRSTVVPCSACRHPETRPGHRLTTLRFCGGRAAWPEFPNTLPRCALYPKSGDSLG